MNSFQTVKLIPVLSALTFFIIFLHAAIQKKELIFKFTTRFYKKPLSQEEIKFLKKGDIFWAVAIFIYILLLSGLVYTGDDALWAFFSSIGWYIYFLITLIIQIIYGKVYAIKMFS
ncbi:hypothetical protein N9X61_03600 [Sulfurimonas sp.]|nr:hypothetical protein [Sulfurimonas sp.]